MKRYFAALAFFVLIGLNLWFWYEILHMVAANALRSPFV